MTVAAEEAFFLHYHLGVTPSQAAGMSPAERQLYIKRIGKKMTPEYPTKSRYKLESKIFTDLHRYVVTAVEDHFNKTVFVTVLDALVGGKPVVYDWINKTLLSPGEETLVLTLHDDNGNALYKKTFTGVKLMGHKSNHDYSCNNDDLQDHEVQFSYEQVTTFNDFTRN